MDAPELPFTSLNEVLEDLASRFILNLPPAEMGQIERICFQIEQAHWFYEDFVRPNTQLDLPSYGLKVFTHVFFQRCAFLRAPGGPLAGWNAETAYDKFMRYKERVPVCGGIMLNPSATKCLLVKGFKSGASWSFPRGKINQDETERECAAREVLEETGFAIGHMMRAGDGSDVAGTDFFEITIREQRLRMYVVAGVPEDWPFRPRTRQEIGRIAWFPLTELPTFTSKRLANTDFALAAQEGRANAKFYMVVPFVGPLKQWLAQQKHRTSNTAAMQHSEPSASSVLTVQLEESVALQQDLNEATRALQRIFFGNGRDSSLPEDTSDIESDYARGVDLATSYASSLGSSYRVPSTQRHSADDRFVAVSPPMGDGDRSSEYTSQWQTPVAVPSQYDNVIAPRPQPPNTVQKLLDIIQASTPLPSSQGASTFFAPEDTPRRHNKNSSDREQDASRLLALLQSAPSMVAVDRKSSPLAADERRQRTDMLLRNLELLANQGSVETALFPPPPGIGNFKSPILPIEHDAPVPGSTGPGAPGPVSDTAARLLSLLSGGTGYEYDQSAVAISPVQPQQLGPESALELLQAVSSGNVQLALV